MRRTILGMAALALIAGALIVAVPGQATASSKTLVVPLGGSIQAAIDRAHKGDTILLSPGTYNESVTIAKDGLTLRGAGSAAGGTVLKPPTKLPKGQCTRASGGSGVCVLGKFDAQFQLKHRVSDVTVSGIVFVGWPSMGVFAFGTDNLRLMDNAVYKTGEYGLARFDSLGGVVSNNVVVGGGEAGIYLGDSADAGAKVSHNDVSGSEIGIFIRHSSGITAQLNHLLNNCQGILVLDDGSGGVSDIQLRYNFVSFNNKVCPGSDEEPPLSGGGIILLGTADSLVSWNVVRGNQGTDINSGGIVLMSAAALTQGATPMRNTVKNNTAFQNSPADVAYDGTGSGNDLTGNYCGTSSPGGFCV